MTALHIRCLSESQPSEFVTSFCEIPYTLRRDPFRVGLLPPEAEALLLTLPLPNLREFWIATRQQRIVGRIGASLSADGTQGLVGFFEVDLEDETAARQLLETAEAWLRCRGIRKVFGPVHINTWFPYRFRVEAHDEGAYSWEPVQPPEYPEQFQAFGFRVDQVYHSDELVDLEAIRKGFEPHYRRTLQAGYTYRPIDTVELERELPVLYRLSLSGFSQNYLFEPISEPVFRALYVAQAAKRKPLGCHFVCHPTRGEVGFTVGFVDEAEQFVLKTLVVLPEVQSQGLSMGLLFEAFGSGVRAGHPSAIAALVQAGNRSEASSRRTPIGWRHTYALFRKDLGE